MSIYYNNGNVIGLLDKLQDAADFKRAIQENGGLPTEIFREDFLFWELYKLCLKPLNAALCSAKGYEIDLEAYMKFDSICTLDDDEDLLSLCDKEILKNFKDTAQRRAPALHRQIRAAMSSLLEQRAWLKNHLYLYMRITLICLLTGLEPQMLFGRPDWEVDIRPEEDDDPNEWKVSAGDILKLNPAASGNLQPITLCNKSNESITVKVNTPNGVYDIQIPSYGILRSTAVEQKGERILTALKGAISVAAVNDQTAYIQLGGEKHDSLVLVNRKGSRILPLNDVLLDAACVSTGGGVILTDGGTIYADGKLEKQFSLARKNRPIRCYGSGKYCALLYADGTLEISGLNQRLTEVSAVVEDGARGLLVVQHGHYWDYRHGRQNSTNQKEFLNIMLSRFVNDGFCERVSSGLMAIRITAEGGWELK